MTNSQEKVLNAIIYFVKNTKYCRKTKLFKLLFFLDFVHFKKFGTTVSGYTYIAMPRGPVPIELYEQMTNDKLLPEFQKSLSILEEKDEDGESKGYKISVRGGKTADLSVFTPNEKTILEEVADIYKEVTAEQISEITHLKNTPWDKTIKTRGENAPIDIFLALDEDTTLEVEEIQERFQTETALRKDARI